MTSAPHVCGHQHGVRRLGKNGWLLESQDACFEAGDGRSLTVSLFVRHAEVKLSPESTHARSLQQGG
jgi:hypothetical protein